MSSVDNVRAELRFKHLCESLGEAITRRLEDEATKPDGKGYVLLAELAQWKETGSLFFLRNTPGIVDLFNAACDEVGIAGERRETAREALFRAPEGKTRG